MRKAINGVSVLVDERMELDQLIGAIFLFCNRPRRILKALYSDPNGFCIWQKRLEKFRFPWADTQEAAPEITGEQIRMLLDGIDFWSVNGALSYKAVF